MNVTDGELRVATTRFPVTVLGPGSRLGIWVQGCQLACRGCMSRDTWDRSGGTVMTVDKLVAMWQRASSAGADGITISGGEPLDQAPALAELLRRVRTAGPPVEASQAKRSPHEPDILVYTGYELAEARDRGPSVLALADAVISGRYEAGKPTRLIWRGSANQQLVPLTELGRSRYLPYLLAEPARPAVQVGLGGGGYWIIGVPRRGDLARLEKALRRRGLTPSGVSWRPDGIARSRAAEQDQRPQEQS